MHKRFLFLFLLFLSFSYLFSIRVVSLAPSITEMLFFIEEGKSIVGNTIYCNYPEESKKIYKIGDMINPDIEKIIKTEPDIIIASFSGSSKDKFERLEKLGYRMLLLKEEKVEDIISNVAILCNVFSKDPKKYIDILSNKQKQIKKKNPPKRFVFLTWLNPMYSASEKTFISDGISKAGYINAIKSDVLYPVIDKEMLFKAKPDVLILPDNLKSEEKYLMNLLKELKLKPEIIYLNGDALSRPSPGFFDVLIELSGK